jgi:hypothetical protein
MKLPQGVPALTAALVVNVALAILLTPLGFESRPPTTLTTIGVMAIVTVFAGIILDLAAIFFIFRRRTRLASILAIVGSLFFVFPYVVDRTGSFFTLPIPPMINILEYVFIAVILVTLFLASMVCRQSNPSPS